MIPPHLGGDVLDGLPVVLEEVDADDGLVVLWVGRLVDLEVLLLRVTGAPGR